MKKRPPLLDFDNVRMIRGGKSVLDGVTFRIDLGENVAILGPNGSGKSSLLKLLTRELYPVANDGPYRMKILGKDRWELFELRRLGIVSDGPQHDFARECSGWEARCPVTSLRGTLGTTGSLRDGEAGVARAGAPEVDRLGTTRDRCRRAKRGGCRSTGADPTPTRSCSTSPRQPDLRLVREPGTSCASSPAPARRSSS
jgi:energy-coupling factor transporter ATP-binding protein EcfA2